MLDGGDQDAAPRAGWDEVDTLASGPADVVVETAGRPDGAHAPAHVAFRAGRRRGLGVRDDGAAEAARRRRVRRAAGFGPQGADAHGAEAPLPAEPALRRAQPEPPAAPHRATAVAAAHRAGDVRGDGPGGGRAPGGAGTRRRRRRGNAAGRRAPRHRRAPGGRLQQPRRRRRLRAGAQYQERVGDLAAAAPAPPADQVLHRGVRQVARRQGQWQPRPGHVAAGPDPLRAGQPGGLRGRAESGIGDRRGFGAPARDA